MSRPKQTKLPGYPLAWGHNPSEPPAWAMPGQRVMHRVVFGDDASEREETIQSAAFQLGDGRWVVQLERSRGVPLYALKPIAPKQPVPGGA